MTALPATPEQLLPLTKWFSLLPVRSGTALRVFVNDHGAYTVRGHVRMHLQPEDGVCPIEFETVTGSFVAINFGLTSCKNIPKKVGQNLFLNGNKLKDLEHGPHSVGGYLDLEQNPLQSLWGFPSHVGEVVLNYSSKLPLLRLISVKQGAHLKGPNTPTIVRTILKKYRGMGKPGALQAAVELIRAGYSENAKW